MMLKPIFLLLALSLSSLAAHEKRDSAPKGFKDVGPTPLDKTLNLRVALVQDDFKGLEDDLYSVSTPGNPRYGKHLSKSEVEQRIAPSKDTMTAFSSWISANGLKSNPLSPSGDWQVVTMTVSKANQLFKANFSDFEHQDLNTTITRTLAYSLPDPLVNHVSVVHPTVVFPAVQSKDSSESASLKHVSAKNTTNLHSDVATVAGKRALPASCTPDPDAIPCMLDLYGIPRDPATQSSNDIWVSGFDNSFAIKQDLADFLAIFRPDITNPTTFDLQTINGGINPQIRAEGGWQAEIGTQYTLGIATNVPVTFMSVGTGNPDDPVTDMLDQANYLLGLDDPPRALLSDFPLSENEISQALATQLCNSYAQLGARGVSLIHSTGYGGVEGATDARQCTQFDVSFPASCPYVTSVGGTGPSVNSDAEIALEKSSGGFSNYFPRPSYQDSVVPPYVNSLGSTYSGLYNASGRGTPDVSAWSSGDFCWGISGPCSNGHWQVSDPAVGSGVFISIIALLNDQLIAKGKSTLGFLNPWIYDNAGMFNDIAVGNNPGCGTDGFNSTAGWDPITGMGSPVFSAMKKAAGL